MVIVPRVKNPIFKIIKIKFHCTGVHYLNKIFVQKSYYCYL